MSLFYILLFFYLCEVWNISTDICSDSPVDTLLYHVSHQCLTMLIWLLSEVWHGIYSGEATVDLKICRFTSFERGVWEHFPFIYKNEKKKKNLKKCTQHSMHIYKNIKWFPSTEYSWRLLFPCEISELAWNQPRAWAQTARSDCPKVGAWEKPWRTDTERVSHEECKGLKAWPRRSHRLY